jgi:hypothetical protein
MALVNRQDTIVESEGNEKYEKNTLLVRDQFYNEVRNKFEHPIGSNKPMT